MTTYRPRTPHSDAIKRPDCSECGTLSRLFGIEPEKPGYELVTAKSGQEALAFALRETFAVALLDIAMPGMSGLEVAVHLKELERSRDIPIIFVTAFGDDPDEIHRAYSAGGADYLVKPLDPEVVRKKVAVFVDLSRRQRRSPNHELI